MLNSLLREYDIIIEISFYLTSKCRCADALNQNCLQRKNSPKKRKWKSLECTGVIFGCKSLMDFLIIE